jgi:hypothetical protein
MSKPLYHVSLVGNGFKGMVLLAMHIDDVAGNAHICDIICVVNHHV